MPNYVTIHGKRSTHFYNSTPEPMLGRKQIAGSSSKRSCGFCAAVRNGACFLKHRVNGTRSTNVLHVGANMGCGQICINISLTTQIWRIFCWTVPSSEHIPAPLERQKKGWTGKPGTWAQSGWVQHQNPRQRRCPGQPATVSPDRRAAPRYHAGRRPDCRF